MKKGHYKILVICLFAISSLGFAWADDLTVSGDIYGLQNYDSMAGIIFVNATLHNNADVSAEAAYSANIKALTGVITGAKFSLIMKDKDGMSNQCEMTYFGTLAKNPNDDEDGDQLTNNEECQLNTDPSVNNPDNDGDGLPDWWEVLYFGIDLTNDPNGDPDGDGISNLVEYKLGIDPTAAHEKGPGIHYKYDELGRILKIERIPSQ